MSSSSRIVGSTNDSLYGPVEPTYWDGTGGPYNQFESTNYTTGTALGVNVGGELVGYLTDAGLRIPMYRTAGGTVFELIRGSFSYGRAYGINSSGVIAGDRYTSLTTDQVPTIWRKDVNGTYQPESLSGWPTARTGFGVDVNDSEVVCGYVNPESGLSNGTPFIYTTANGLRLLDVAGNFGQPVQIDEDGSFFVEGPNGSYLWIGETTSSGKSAFIDLPAFLEPGTSTTGLRATGVNDVPRFGGQFEDGSGAGAWVASVSTDWTRVAPNALSVVSGTNLGGSVSSLANPDADALEIQRATFGSPGTDPVQIEVTAQLPVGVTNPSALVARATTRNSASGTFTQRFELYDWTTGSYDEFRSDSTATVLATKDLTATGTLSRYVNSNREVKARVKVSSSGPVSGTWSIYFEQVNFMYKP